MCEDADGYNDVQTSTRRKARKEHQCCACDETIRVGDHYMRSFCVYDGSADDYKHCLRCWLMLEALWKELPRGTAVAWELNCGELWANTIGDLPEHIAALAFATPAEMQARALEVKP